MNRRNFHSMCGTFRPSGRGLYGTISPFRSEALISPIHNSFQERAYPDIYRQRFARAASVLRLHRASLAQFDGGVANARSREVLCGHTFSASRIP